MKRVRTISLSRLGTALALSAPAGLQVGLYAADEFDDGVSDPLSFWIGVSSKRK